jgi:hypothetical protein
MDGTHFHIRWSTIGLDWERFGSQADAEEAAKQLARPGETYTVEQFDAACLTCAEFGKRLTAR